MNTPYTCKSCWPCPTPDSCDCACHDPALLSSAKFTWNPGDVIVTRSRFHLAVHRQDITKLVETIPELAEAAAELGQTPDQLLTELIDSGSLSDAPASLTDALVRRGVIRPASE